MPSTQQWSQWYLDMVILKWHKKGPTSMPDNIVPKNLPNYFQSYPKMRTLRSFSNTMLGNPSTKCIKKTEICPCANFAHTCMKILLEDHLFILGGLTMPNAGLGAINHPWWSFPESVLRNSLNIIQDTLTKIV